MMRELAIDAARALYLFAPLLVAAAISGVFLRYDLAPALARPIDGGAVLGGRRVFGDGKTWRGGVTAVVGCVIGVAIQRAIAGVVPAALQVVDYARVEPVVLGAAMGAGATLGELPNSFVKRRAGIPRGGTARGWKGVVFYVWDQVDLLIGAWPLIAALVAPRPRLIAASFAVALVVHPLVALIGWLIGARTSPR